MLGAHVCLLVQPQVLTAPRGPGQPACVRPGVRDGARAPGRTRSSVLYASTVPTSHTVSTAVASRKWLGWGTGLQVGLQEGPPGPPKPWKRASCVTRCRQGWEGEGGGLGCCLVWSSWPFGRPKLAMLLLEPSVPPFGGHTISAGALGSLGLVRYNAHVEPHRQEAGRDRSEPGLPAPTRDTWGPQPRPTALSAPCSDDSPNSGHPRQGPAGFVWGFPGCQTPNPCEACRRGLLSFVLPGAFLSPFRGVTSALPLPCPTAVHNPHLKVGSWVINPG